MTKYAATPAQWDAVAAACERAGICGLDTETYGYDIGKAGPVGRARIHVWSLAAFLLAPESASPPGSGSTSRPGTARPGPADTRGLPERPSAVLRSPRGHAYASGVVLPAAALQSPSIRALLRGRTTKVAHNAPHDVHALSNEGVEVRNWQDSLPRARVLLPREAGHGLKSLCRLVGRTLRKYEDVVTMDVDVPFAARRCICGADRCQRRSKGHERQDVTVYRRLPRPQPLESIVPGHALWDGLLEYAAEDAVAALELWDYMDQLQPFTAPDPGWGPDWGAGPAPPRNA